MKCISFNTTKELENQFAKVIAEKLSFAVKVKGKASMLVSGGSTPIGLFHLLSLKEIDWHHVTIGLVDERFLSVNHSHSNEKMVRENLLINEAKAANFISMIYSTENEKENEKLANKQYQMFHNNIDVCILGMGQDGHTASLFPNDYSSTINLRSKELCLISTRAPHEPKERISCSKALILSSNALFLMLIGNSKKLVLQQSIANQLPIAHFINVNPLIEIYYSENK